MSKLIRKLGESELALDLIAIVVDLAIPLQFSGDIFKAAVVTTAIISDLRKKPRGPHRPEVVIEKLSELIRLERFDEAKELLRRLGLPRRDEEAMIRQIDEIKDRPARIRKWNEHLNTLLRQGDFGGAVRFIQSLDLPQDAKDKVSGRIREVEREHKETMAQIQKWNEHLNSLLHQGDFDGAVRFVRSLDLPWKKKDEIIARIDEIRQTERQYWEGRAEAQKWSDDPNARLRRGDYRLRRGDYNGAARFVRSSDLPRDEKDKLVSRINEDEQRYLKQHRQTEEWYNEVVYLLNVRKEREARKYIRSLPIDKDAQEALLKRAREALGLHLV